MCQPPISPTTWKRVVTAIAFAALTSGLVLSASSPADAKPRTCGQRSLDCNQRCMKNNKDPDGQISCVQRTCTHQFNQCYAAEGGRGPMPKGPREPKEPKEPKRPKGGGKR